MLIRINLAGKKQGKYKSCQIKCDSKSLGRVGILLKFRKWRWKQYKEKSTLSNGELLPDPNVSISLLSNFQYLQPFLSFTDTNTTLLIIKRKNPKEVDAFQNNAASKHW